MFTCDVTKERSFARNFVSRELSFNGKNDKVVLEFQFDNIQVFSVHDIY